MLPFYLFVRQSDRLSPHEFEEGQYRVKISPPCRAAVDPSELDGLSSTPIRQSLDLLHPHDTQFSPAIQINGAQTCRANLLQIDFHKPDFDRTRQFPEGTQARDKGDPPIDLCFRIANQFLGRLRTLTRGHKIKSVSTKANAWRLDYLTDDGQELPADPTKIRRQLGAHFSGTVVSLTTDVWESIKAIPTDYTPLPWDTLLLDAEALLPEIGPSLVVANAALEIFIEWALDIFAKESRINTDIWRWINNRRERSQNPSVTEQYDVLLKALVNKSLKEQPPLWESFQHLRSARNSYAHEGVPMIGDAEVTLKTATYLLTQAKAVIDWAEQLLPPETRRPVYQKTLEVLIRMNPGP